MVSGINGGLQRFTGTLSGAELLELVADLFYIGRCPSHVQPVLLLDNYGCDFLALDLDQFKLVCLWGGIVAAIIVTVSYCKTFNKSIEDVK